MGNGLSNKYPIRINKFLSLAGVCSRRKADDYILDRRVKINNQFAVIGDTINENDIVLVDDEQVQLPNEVILLAYNKPKGVECTHDSYNPRSIDNYIQSDIRLFCIGRLDISSHGLILLTNNGDLSHHLLHPSNDHTKVYNVKVDRDLEENEINKIISGGIPLEIGIKSSACEISKLNPGYYQLTLCEGRNRQIRKLFGFFDISVLDILRIKFGPYELESLGKNQTRTLPLPIDFNQKDS